MPNNSDDDLLRILNFEQSNVAGTAERNDEFTQEWTSPRLSATEWAVHKKLASLFNRLNCAGWNIQISGWAVQLTF
jgi:hypothetical protein